MWYWLALMRALLQFFAVCLLGLSLSGCALAKVAGSVLKLPFTLLKGLTGQVDDAQPSPDGLVPAVRGQEVRERAAYAGNIADRSTGVAAGSMVSR